MVSLIEQMEAREAAAGVRVEALESQIAELAERLEAERETWSRLRVTRETLAEVVAERSVPDTAGEPGPEEPAGSDARGGGAPWCPTGGKGCRWMRCRGCVPGHRGGGGGRVGSDAGIQPSHPPRSRHQAPQSWLTSKMQVSRLSTCDMRRTKLTVVRSLVPVAILVSSPVLLLAGAPIRRRYLRYVYRDRAPPILDKKQGWVRVRYVVITSRLLEGLCWPTQSLARITARRG